MEPCIGVHPTAHSTLSVILSPSRAVLGLPGHRSRSRSEAPDQNSGPSAGLIS